MILEDQIALVTGASRGIGRSLAEGLAGAFIALAAFRRAGSTEET